MTPPSIPADPGAESLAPPLLRLVVFDMDGTLVNSGAYIGRTMVRAFTEERLELPSAELVRAIIGLSLEKALEQLCGRSGAAIDRLAATYRRLYHQSIAEVGTEPLYEGVREVLDALAAERSTLLAIATGKGLRGVERVLKVHGIMDRFVSFQTPNSNPSKPDPGMLFSAMRETGVAPERTVMVGDTAYDMDMARAAGCFALGVAWGYHRPEDLRRAGAEAVVERVADLVPALNALMIAHA